MIDNSPWENVGMLEDETHAISSDEDQDPQRRTSRAVRRRASRTLSESRHRSPSRTTQIPKEMVEMQAQMAQMATMMMEMQEMATAAKAKAKSRSKAAGSGQTAPKENKKAALTGREADFPTLSHRYSYDVTFNILGSITEQALTFKWKLLLLMLRMKQAVEADKSTRRRWKRNPRWIMHMNGRFLAGLWGHLGSARQLCFNPKVYPLALADTEEKESKDKRRGSKGSN